MHTARNVELPALLGATLPLGRDDMHGASVTANLLHLHHANPRILPFSFSLSPILSLSTFSLYILLYAPQRVWTQTRVPHSQVNLLAGGYAEPVVVELLDHGDVIGQLQDVQGLLVVVIGLVVGQLAFPYPDPSPDTQRQAELGFEPAT